MFALLIAGFLFHPFHVSVAEVEYNASSKKLECSLRVWPIDLEKSLTKLAGKKIDLDRSPDIDKWIRKLLKKEIVVLDDKKTCLIEYAGKEIDAKQVWLYFEIDTGKAPENLFFSNRLFFGIHQDQINLFHIKNGRRRASLSFSPKKPTHQLVTKDFQPTKNPFLDPSKKKR